MLHNPIAVARLVLQLVRDLPSHGVSCCIRRLAHAIIEHVGGGGRGEVHR